MYNITEGGSSRGNLCFICGSHVYLLERTVARQRLFHRQCFVCNGCGTKLLLGMYEVYDGDSMFYCKSCFKLAPFHVLELLTFCSSSYKQYMYG